MSEDDPSKWRCDFCGVRHQVEPLCWTYLTPRVAASEEEALRDGTFWADDPEWGACGPCHDLIEAGDLEGLIQRSVDRQLAIVVGDPALSRAFNAAGQREIRRIHETFWQHRRGEAIPE